MLQCRKAGQGKLLGIVGDPTGAGLSDWDACGADPGRDDRHPVGQGFQKLDPRPAAGSQRDQRKTCPCIERTKIRHTAGHGYAGTPPQVDNRRRRITADEQQLKLRYPDAQPGPYRSHEPQSGIDIRYIPKRRNENQGRTVVAAGARLRFRHRVWNDNRVCLGVTCLYALPIN
jgi:hypothetical protein